MDERRVPTLYEWVGGSEMIERLFTLFYQRVSDDDLLAPIFANLSAEHVKHVTAFVSEVFGGPQSYSQQYGGHPAMVRRHVGRALTEQQRQHWMRLLLDCADAIGIKSDPEFRSALVGYLEWGTRIAVINSQPGAVIGSPGPMPKWDWGPVKGPYMPDPPQ